MKPRLSAIAAAIITLPYTLATAHASETDKLHNIVADVSADRIEQDIEKL